MKRIIMAMAMAVAALPVARACDVCGCAASNQYLGLLPQFQRNFIGFQQQYSEYTSTHPSAYMGRPWEQGADYYNTFQLWGRYNINRHYQVFVFVPYHYNVHNEDSAHATGNGIGDITLLVNRQLLNKQKGHWQQTLQAGAGIKLPTGKYTGITQLDKEGLPNMQPGTGSWDFVVNGNYTVRRKMIGANADASYTLTTANKYSYKYGNRLNTGILAFYNVSAGKINLLPQAGVRYEYTLHDYDNYSHKWLNDQSGGYMCFATAGVQAYYRQVGMRVLYQLPLAQYYSTGYLTAHHKLETGVFFLF